MPNTLSGESLNMDIKEKEFEQRYKEEQFQKRFEEEQAAAQDLELNAEQYDSSWVPGMPSAQSITGAMAATDFLDSPVRSGVSEFAKGKYVTGGIQEKIRSIGAGLKAAGSQLATNMESPIQGPAQSPSYGEIIDREMRMNTIPNLLTSETQKSAASNVGNIAAEMVVPSATFGAISKIPTVSSKLTSFLSKSKQALKRTETNQLSKVLAGIQTRAQFDPKVSNINPEIISKHLVEADLSKYVSDPVKMREAITGEKRTAFEDVSEGSVKEIYEPGDGGLIGKKLTVMKDEVEEAANKAGRSTRVPTFALKEKIKQKNQLADPLSGERYSPQIMARREKIMDELLKPLDEEIVPGVPFESLPDLPIDRLPPITPPEPADMFPMSRQGNIPDPELPVRPEHPGMDFPGNPPSHSHFNLVKKTPAPPKQPQAYGGVIPEATQEKYLEDYANWESEVAKINKEYAKAESEAKALDEGRRVGQEKTRESLASDVNAKYDSAIKAWEEEVTRLTRETKEARASGMAYDEKVMAAKVKQAAERFEARAKKNKAFKEEIIDLEEEYLNHVVDALNSKVFKVPRTWNLRDMMNLRSNIGKRLASRDFNTNAALSMEKDVATSIYDSLRDEIAVTLKGLPTKVKDARTGGFLDASEHYDIQSKAAHRFMQVAEVLKDSKFHKLQGSDTTAEVMASLAAIGIGGGTLGATHVLDGSSTYLPATALGFLAARTSYKGVKENAPEILTRGSRLARKGIEGIEQYPQQSYKALNLGTRALRDNYVMQDEEPKLDYGRKYNSIGSSDMTPVQVDNARLPTTSEGLLQNKKLLLAKLALKGEDPAYIMQIAQALKKSPERLGTLFVELSSKYPDDFFEKSKHYYKIFDGSIVDPDEAGKAADDTQHRTDLTSIQKAKIISELNKPSRKWLGE